MEGTARCGTESLHVGWSVTALKELWNYGNDNWVSFKVQITKMLNKQSLWRHRSIPVEGKETREEEVSVGGIQEERM